MKQSHRASGRHLNREPRSPRPAPSRGVVVGTLCEFDATGVPRVEFRKGGSAHRVDACATVELDENHVGRTVVLAFEGDDASRPIVIGVIRDARPRAPKKSDASLEGKQLVITAEQEIVLRSGKASITLTQDGRVILQGEYLVSRATGVNRIKGGSVQIN